MGEDYATEALGWRRQAATEREAPKAKGTHRENWSQPKYWPVSSYHETLLGHLLPQDMKATRRDQGMGGGGGQS